MARTVGGRPRWPVAVRLCSNTRMLRIEFAPADLAGLRFAHSPMVEVVTSAFALHRPDGSGCTRPGGPGCCRCSPARGWRRSSAVVTGPTGYVPDFLTPVPATARPSLADELRVVAATPLDQVAREVDAAWAGHPAPPEIARFGTDPAGALAELVREIRRYFELAVAPAWPRLRAAVEGELAHRARTAAEHGPRALLAGLHPNLDWDGSALRLAHTKSRDWGLDGHALTLLPAGFAGPPVHLLTEAPDGRALWYPPRGYGRLWDQPEQVEPAAALAALLGPTRAAVLTLLAVPCSTGEVGDRAPAWRPRPRRTT